ncbi:MAG: glycosyltransferase [Syntrophales bacterium]|nr:glycosyltransferase [Syntrophales bacterium]MDD5533445.1 glycosyltransferase [Syntrophales bacterium]
MEYIPIRVQDYAPFVGDQTVERILAKAEPLRGLHVINFNSTYYGGGVAELLSSMTILMNGLSIKTGWRVIQGSPDFFGITKKMHNALQGMGFKFSRIKRNIYESVIAENSIRNHLDHDFVIVHDPQPLPLIRHYKKKSPWVWRCHIDLSNPNRDLWNYFVPIIEKYDAAVFSIPEYAQKLNIPQVFFLPAIDPFTTKNRLLTDREMDERLCHYNIPTDLPLVVQVSRFDPWKDPKGVIKAFKLARKEVDCTLVLLGNFASDDPEGAEIYESLVKSREERILILPNGDDTALVNTLQRRAAVVLQKSIREGFGLTVTEAMWKGTPVIGGNVGGIRYQIRDGETGFLVSSIEEAAARIVQLVKDRKLREEMGRKARAVVAEKFLLTRYVEQYLDLFNSFEPHFELKGIFDRQTAFPANDSFPDPVLKCPPAMKSR